MQKVVVTGMGMVTPLGSGVRKNWSRLIEGENGIVPIDRFDASDFPSRVAGQVPEGSEEEGLFDPDRWVSAKERRRIERFIVYAIAAADQAISDSGYAPKNDEETWRAGVIIGSGIGGLQGICDTALAVKHRGSRWVSPFFLPACLVNLASGHVSIRHKLRGPNHAVATACATGAHAIGDAARMIMFGDADVMVAGGAESCVTEVGIAGFAAMKALSTKYNDRPECASRPWDSNRDGFVIGEGAGVLVLEALEHAQRRGAHIHAEIVGYGLSGDAHHITAPHPEGIGARLAMLAALRNAHMSPDEIDYINAHGTSTPLGDRIEIDSVKKIFGEHAKKLSVSSTKSAIGHLLGAAGSVEAIYSILALTEQIVPPTRNLDEPSEGCDLDLVPHVAKDLKVRAVLSNSFGFGGTNASLIFRPLQ